MTIMRNRPEKKIMTAENVNHEGAAFLEDVTLKIEKRLDEIRRDLHEGQKEIENMHEYYWEDTRITIISRRFCSRRMQMQRN